MKAKHALIILATGYCIDFVAAMFKLEHWEYGDELIIIATVFKVVGFIAFLAKLMPSNIRYTRIVFGGYAIAFFLPPLK